MTVKKVWKILSLSMYSSQVHKFAFEKLFKVNVKKEIFRR